MIIGDGGPGSLAFLLWLVYLPSAGCVTIVGDGYPSLIWLAYSVDGILDVTVS